MYYIYIIYIYLLPHRKRSKLFYFPEFYDTPIHDSQHHENVHQQLQLFLFLILYVHHVFLFLFQVFQTILAAVCFFKLAVFPNDLCRDNIYQFFFMSLLNVFQMTNSLCFLFPFSFFQSNFM